MRVLLSFIAMLIALFSISMIHTPSAKHQAHATAGIIGSDSVVAASPEILKPNCLNTNNCTQEQLVSYTYVLVKDEIDVVSDKTNIYILLSMLAIVVACLPISNWIYDKSKK